MPGRRADRRPGLAPHLNPTIRNAVAADRAFIEGLGKQTVMDSVSALRDPDPVAVVENFDRLLEIVETHGHLSLIAECDGVAAGFVLVLDSLPDEVTGDDQAFVAYMAVRPEHRGRGVGRALLERAEDEARRKGTPYISLMVTEENLAARTLYERAGYRSERRLMCKTL